MTEGQRAAVVASFRHRHEAELARGYLEDAGLPAAVQVDDAGGAYAGIDHARVLVREEDLRRARRILSEAGMA